jgi:hypothetical protein
MTYLGFDFDNAHLPTNMGYTAAVIALNPFLRQNTQTVR